MKKELNAGLCLFGLVLLCAGCATNQRQPLVFEYKTVKFDSANVTAQLHQLSDEGWSIIDGGRPKNGNYTLERLKR